MKIIETMKSGVSNLISSMKKSLTDDNESPLKSYNAGEECMNLKSLLYVRKGKYEGMLDQDLKMLIGKMSRLSLENHAFDEISTGGYKSAQENLYIRNKTMSDQDLKMLTEKMSELTIDDGTYECMDVDVNKIEEDMDIDFDEPMEIDDDELMEIDENENSFQTITTLNMHFSVEFNILVVMP